jgi:hypothetical protein
METIEKKQSTTEAAGYAAGVGIGLARSALRGKHISASIIVLAGAILILGGSYIRHDDTKLFVQVVGCIFSAIGLVGWFVSTAEK